MNILLPTNDDNRLGFHGVQRYSDNSGFCANLIVRCYGFSGEMLFCVEPHPFVAFVEALEAMDRSLTGRARLKPVYEEPYVELELDRLGRVLVTGELISRKPSPETVV